MQMILKNFYTIEIFHKDKWYEVFCADSPNPFNTFSFHPADITGNMIMFKEHREHKDLIMTKFFDRDLVKLRIKENDPNGNNRILEELEIFVTQLEIESDKDLDVIRELKYVREPRKER